ncbi:MAG: DUF1499 domain-containing protein [Paracoccaceae bacterium]
MLRLAFAILVTAPLLGLAYVRLGPDDVARWHVDPAAAPEPGSTGDRRVVDVSASPTEALGALDRAVLDLPRSARLAGTAEEGRMTWIVRSRVMGFPDYVTAAAAPLADGARLTILSRLRYGRDDMGVNAARLDELLTGFDPR